MPHSRLSASTTTLLVVDIQEKLLPAIPAATSLVRNVEFLLDVARLVGVDVRVTEQYPQGLGPTIARLATKLPTDRPAKRSFSCCGAPGLTSSLEPHRPWILLVGMETHVCVSQTALDLLHLGYRVTVAVDAVAARFRIDHDTALERLRGAGVILTTVEAVAFEWVGSSEHAEFRTFSRLVQERAKDIGSG